MSSRIAVLLCFVLGGHAAALTGSGDSSVGAITTVAPVFSALHVEPNRAGAGATVTITFTVSRPLDADPVVLVAGNDAVFVSENSGTYLYTYLMHDAPLGPVIITINGADPLGNSGNLSSDLVLELIEVLPLPLCRWPVFVALLAVGALAIARSARHGANLRSSRCTHGLLLSLVLLSVPVAGAQVPSVTNVIFVQQANGAGGTEVIITYDLDAPNGPSDITVALSKNAGADGFPFSATTIAGDVSSVSTGTGKRIVWQVALDYPNEDIPLARIRVTADDSFLPPPPEMINVPAGTFTMGRRDDGDDAIYGVGDELPRHEVTLSTYDIGKFEVTNQQVCNVYNWAMDQGYVSTVNAGAAQAFGRVLLDLDSPHGHIEFSAGAFRPASRTGLPGTTSYSMADHPVQNITWHGAVAYCNWLSEIAGLTPIYDTGSWTAIFTNDGFHLPTEAQWERAAAWDGSKHWVYGFSSDTLEDNYRCNYYTATAYGNPLGITSYPYTSPVGWFDGLHQSPNANVATLDSPSPVGCYDMSGNVAEWCHDWYDADYYTIGGPTWIDPAGPPSGVYRTVRGGSWAYSVDASRSAKRSYYGYYPHYTSYLVGFRVARTLGAS